MFVQNMISTISVLKGIGSEQCLREWCGMKKMFVGKANDNGCSIMWEKAINQKVSTYTMMHDQKKLGHKFVSCSFILDNLNKHGQYNPSGFYAFSFFSFFSSPYFLPHMCMPNHKVFYASASSPFLFYSL